MQKRKEKLELWLEAIEENQPYDDYEENEDEDIENEEDEEDIENEEDEEDVENEEEKEDDEKEEVEESIVAMNEAEMAVEFERRHFEYLVDLFAKILSSPILKINSPEDKKYKEIEDLILVDLAPTNRGFKRDRFAQRMKQAFNDIKNESEKAETEISDSEE